MTKHKDLFSKQAKAYLQARPAYPSELFTFIASYCQQHISAWDVATGNGQAAMQLSKHFQQVFATDISAEQLELAQTSDQIDYRHANAEQSTLGANSIDCVIAAQAIHWLDLSAFYQELARVTKPAAIFAIINYRDFKVSPAIDELLNSTLIQDILGPYWDKTNKAVFDSKLEYLPFPFATVACPQFAITLSLSQQELLALVQTYSADQTFAQQHQYSATTKVIDELTRLWGEQTKRLVKLPLLIKIGRVK